MNVIRSFLVLMLWVSFSQKLPAESRKPQVENGVLNLEGWNFEASDLILHGDWSYFPNRLDSEEDLQKASFLRDKPSGFIQTGSNWTDVEFGTATYILHLKGQTNEHLGLAFSQFIFNYRAYFYSAQNQELTRLASAGAVNSDRDRTKYQFVRRVVPLPRLNADGNYLIIQTSRFFMQGSFDVVPKLGNYAALKAEVDHRTWECFWIIGLFCMLAISNASLFLLRRDDKASLLMSVFSFLVCLRYFATEAIFPLLFPEPGNFSFYFMLMTVGLSLPICLAVYLHFISVNFPKSYPRWGLLMTWAISCILTVNYLLAFALPGFPLMLPFLGALVVPILLMFRSLFQLMKRRESSSGILFFGIAILIAALGFDVVNFFYELDFVYVGHYGMVLFILTQSLVVGRNFARAFLTAQRLSRHLQDEIERQTRDVKAILRSIQLGILPIGVGQVAGDDHSLFLTEILGRKDISDRPLKELLFASSDLSLERQSMLSSVLEASLGEPAFAFEVNASNLAKEFKYQHPDGEEKMLVATWDPVINEKSGNVEKILLALRDVTKLRIIENISQKQSRLIQIISEIIEIEPHRFTNFMQSSQRFVEENQRLFSERSPLGSTLNIMFINLHTIKGSSRTFGLSYITEAVHEAEDYIAEVRKGNTEWLTKKAKADLSRILDIIKEYELIGREKLHMADSEGRVEIQQSVVHDLVEDLVYLEDFHADYLQDPAMQRIRRALFGLYFKDLKGTLHETLSALPRIAKDLQKPAPRVEIKGVTMGISRELAVVLNDSLIHILRNIMDHGIEFPAEREAKGKSASGKVVFQITLDAQGFPLLSISDDGQGLSIARIRTLAQEKGLMSGENWTHEDIVSLIFQSGFSTAEQLTEISGRGVGMSAVKEFLEKIGGGVRLVVNKSHEAAPVVPFEILITIPPKHCTRTLETSGQQASA